MPDNEETCPAPECEAIIYWEQDRCTACGYNLEAPNVRLAQKEQEALQQRYANARTNAQQQGTDAILDALTQKVEHESKAVINVSPDYLKGFLESSRDFYSGYALLTAAEIRAAADFNNDTARRAAEGKLFGAIAPHIRYAALSLDGRGLISYGSCSLSLKQPLCARTASLLEDNSFDFVEKHRLLPRTPIPPGYRSTWKNRHLLAAAKLASDLTKHTTANNFSQLLLYSDGNRQTDRFIEVHLYGPFDVQAIEAALIPNPDKACKTEIEQHRLYVIRDLLEQRKIAWNPA